MKSFLLFFFILVIGLAAAQVPNQLKDGEGNIYDFKLMPDNKFWITDNLKINIPGSYCYDGAKGNCDRYGRLYTWEAAQQACKTLGETWRLPTSDEWQELAKHYGGVFGNSTDSGKSVYKALLQGGISGFDAVLGGGRSPDGKYGRGDAHGFYWTATENNSTTAPFYNFGKGSGKLFLQPEGEKTDAFAVRCVKE
jgi:uncharacterized protein (TIGR02145 family)